MHLACAYTELGILYYMNYALRQHTRTARYRIVCDVCPSFESNLPLNLHRLKNVDSPILRLNIINSI